MARNIKPIPKNPQEISQEQVTPYLVNEEKPIIGFPSLTK